MPHVPVHYPRALHACTRPPLQMDMLRSSQSVNSLQSSQLGANLGISNSLKSQLQAIEQTMTP